MSEIKTLAIYKTIETLVEINHQKDIDAFPVAIILLSRKSEAVQIATTIDDPDIADKLMVLLREYLNNPNTEQRKAKMQKCPMCKGYGSYGLDGKDVECKVCKGSGTQLVTIK